MSIRMNKIGALVNELVHEPNLIKKVSAGLKTPQAKAKTYKLFTYDGRPLSEIKQGDMFQLEALPGEMKIKSVYTKATYATSDFGSVAYAYNGNVVGMCDGRAKYIKKLLKKHRVFVTAQIEGYDSWYGYPLVVLYLDN